MDGWRLDRVGETQGDTDRRFDTMPIYGGEQEEVEPAHLRVRRARLAEAEDDGALDADGQPRRHRALRWLLSGVAMMLIVGGGFLLWQVYRTTSGPQDREVPVLWADTNPIRIAPENPGGLDVPHRNRLVLEGTETPADLPQDEDTVAEAAAPEEPMTEVVAAMRDGIGGPEVDPLAPEEEAAAADSDEAVAADLRAAMEALILRGGQETETEAAVDEAAAEQQLASAAHIAAPPGVVWDSEPDFRDRIGATAFVQPPTRVIARPLVGRTEEARPVGHRGEGEPGALAVLGADLAVAAAADAPHAGAVEAAQAAPSQTLPQTAPQTVPQTVPEPAQAAVPEVPEAAAPAAAPEPAPPEPESLAAAPAEVAEPDAAPTAPVPAHRPADPPPLPASASPAEQIAAAPPPPAAPALPTHGVQVVAVPSELEAATEWARFQDRFPDLLTGRRLEVQRVDLGDRGVWFRVMATGTSRSDADGLCSALRSRGADCIVRDL
ncbi:MAG: SPOR domain-containing protein [Rhodospirillaceae bacterium]|nr:SPOR domain-containing protein [Rhodospirillaceae bacterium]